MKKTTFPNAFLPIIGIVLFVQPLNAQTSRPIELSQAVEMGVTYSRQLQLDSSSLLIADSRMAQGRNAQSPEVGIHLSYLRISNNIKPFTIPVNGKDFELNPQILNQSYNSVVARQTIYAGGRAKYANQLLALDKKAIAYDLQANKSDVVYNITALWYNLFTANQSKKVVEANIEVLNNQRRDADNLVKQGILLGNELLKIELAVTNLQSSLSDITNTQTVLKYNLCTLTGLDPQAGFDIPETLPIIKQENSSLDQYIQKAASSRPELKRLSIRREQAGTSLKIARSNYMPVISANALYNYDRPNQRVFPNQAAFTGTWSTGITLGWSITGLFTNKAKVQEAKLSALRINTSLDQVKDNIRMEVNADYSNYLQTRQQIGLARKSVEQAKENFRVEQNKFRANTTTSTDYITANTSLVQAELNLVTALANSDLAYQRLMKSTNNQ